MRLAHTLEAPAAPDQARSANLEVRTKFEFRISNFLQASSFGLRVLTAVLIFVLPAIAHAYPKPSEFPVSWELKFKHGTPKRIAVKAPGSDLPKAYWYMTFSITNPTDQEQQFLPEFELLTREGEVIRSDKNIPAEVFDAIKSRERNKGLEPLSKIAGRILVGEDQTRDGVAIWPEPANPRMGTFSIFVGGLSGETCYMKDGQELDKDKINWHDMSPEDKKALVVLHKQLQLTFQIPGDEFYPGEDAVLDKGKEWVMR